MARIYKNVLSIELTEYVIRCIEENSDGSEKEICKVTEYLAGCDKLVAEKIVRQALGIPRLTRKQRVYYDAVASKMYRIDTKEIAKRAFSIE